MKDRPRISIAQTQRLQLNLGLAASIKVLRADAEGLTRYLEEQASENPCIGLARAPHSEWLPRWSMAFGQAQDGEDQQASAAPSLMAHVMGGVESVTRPGRERAIAQALAEGLEPSGWLGVSLAEVAHEVGASLPEVEAVLVKVQRLEPTGIFARNLAECLRLQAAEAGCLDPVLAQILDHLDLLAAGETARLARLCKVAEADVMARLRLIRGFDPKPGAQFEQGAAPLREPDLTARKTDVGWQVALNRSALPAMTLHRPGTRPMDPDAKAQWAAAKLVARMVEGRNTTLLRVGTEILRRQEAALDNGRKALVPMTMAAVAQTLGLHESTVSRVVAGTAVDTPNGTWWLRGLFTAALGDGVSAATVQAAIGRMIAAEDPAKPLSDEALVQALAAEGMTIARRTVAKYREALHIPPAHRRRRARAHGRGLATEVGDRQEKSRQGVTPRR